MKKYLFIAVIAILAYGYVQERNITVPFFSSWSQSDDSVLQQAYNNRQSDLQVEGEGVVIKILPDDLEGSRHQRFVLRLSSGQTLMVAHNIDLAPRISRLNREDTVEFYGEYEWNEKGGVIHWTHHDPRGRHAGGWLRHEGKTYQ
jgi:uncharacterized protein DUF3465